jgi:predicted site-specific integrase-resolvase
VELTVEEKWRRSRAALSMLLGTSIKAISQAYGKEGLEKVAREWEKNNKKASQRLMEIVGRQEKNLETVAESLISPIPSMAWRVHGQRSDQRRQ